MPHGLPAALGQIPGLPGLPPPVSGTPSAGLATLAAASSGLVPPSSAAGLLALTSLGGIPHLPPGMKEQDLKDVETKLVSSL